jgi:FKBP-type peptidyl-prolyl cis-trans isomerase FklB
MTFPGRSRTFLIACTVAVLVAGVSLAQTPPPASGAPAASTPAAAKKPAAKGADSKASEKSAASYSLGVSMGEQLKASGVGSDQVSPERLGQGVRDALAGKAKLTDADRTNISNLVKNAHEQAGDVNHRAAAKFLAENNKKPDIVTTASGLQYKVISPGSGESPKGSDEVVVNYRGSLLDGTEFDSSYKRGQPATFQVNRIIPGWTEALQLMKPGAKYQLFIPPQLAYDLRSPPPIPPGSMLIFDVELISVKAPAPASAQPPGGVSQPPSTPPASQPK